MEMKMKSYFKNTKIQSRCFLHRRRNRFNPTTICITCMCIIFQQPSCISDKNQLTIYPTLSKHHSLLPRPPPRVSRFKFFSFIFSLHPCIPFLVVLRDPGNTCVNVTHGEVTRGGKRERREYPLAERAGQSPERISRP